MSKLLDGWNNLVNEIIVCVLIYDALKFNLTFLVFNFENEFFFKKK